MKHSLKSVRGLAAALLVLGCTRLFAADQLPIGGISHVGFRVSDLEKTRAFYTGMLHIQEAFNQKDASGKITLAVFKITEEQFLEFSPGSPAGFTHLAFLSQKLERLRQLVETLGLNPPELRTGRDRTRNFSIKDPDNHRIEFVQYEPDSMQAQSRGKFLDNRRIVSHLDHVGMPVAYREAALAFYRGKLGFVEGKPGLWHPPDGPDDSVELLPATASFHLCLDVAIDEGLPAHDPDGIGIEQIGHSQ